MIWHLLCCDCIMHNNGGLNCIPELNLVYWHSRRIQKPKKDNMPDDPQKGLFVGQAPRYRVNLRGFTGSGLCENRAGTSRLKENQ